jgi:hypothetical protein
MKKPPLQDVIVKNREPLGQRTSSDIRDKEGLPYTPVSEEPYRENREAPPTTRHPNVEHSEPPFMRRPRRRSALYHPRKRRWLIVALGIGAIVLLSSIALSLLFAGATVTVYPKQDTVVVNAILTAEEEKTADEHFAIAKMAITDTATREVVALEEKEVEERASGKVILYNEFSETPQRIIPRTRFESSNGLIFRVAEAVEIPGMKSDGTPGEIEITITAEEPGVAHNIGPDSFTLPGYTEAGLLTHAEKIYARSTEAMTGGFKGVRRTVDEAQRTAVEEELQAELRDRLLSNAFTSQDNPEDHHLFKDAVFFEFNTLPDEIAGTDKVIIGVEGKLHGLLFPTDAFAERLADRTLSTYSGTPIRIENAHELSVSATPVVDEEAKTTTSNPWEAQTYKVTVEGKAHFIWEYDKEKLAIDFAGKEKDILTTPFDSSFLEEHSGIDRVEVSIRPFWKGSFPESADDIHVITELDD